MQAPLPKLDPELTERWTRLADQAPLSCRLPLCMGGAVVGSVAQSLMEFLNGTGVHLRWQVSMDRDGPCCHLPVDPEPTFAAIGHVLLQHGFISGAGVERLAILDVNGNVLGSVPRNLARYMGVKTHSVHLVGWQGGVCWVQERASNKAEDPGLLDTLVGGTVALEDSLSDTLERETWEEAGLSLRQLEGLTSFGTIELTQPGLDPEGWRYQVETVHCLSAHMVAGAQAVNQDGEVAAFHRFTAKALSHALATGRFTLAATGVYLRVAQAIPVSARINF